MKGFPDISYLCATYHKQDNTARAGAFNADLEEPLPVSTFLLLEFRQFVRFQGRLFEKGRCKGFPKTEGAAMLRALQSILAGAVLVMVAPDWAGVHRIA